MLSKEASRPQWSQPLTGFFLEYGISENLCVPIYTISFAKWTFNLGTLIIKVANFLKHKMEGYSLRVLYAEEKNILVSKKKLPIVSSICKELF